MLTPCSGAIENAGMCANPGLVNPLLNLGLRNALTNPWLGNVIQD